MVFCIERFSSALCLVQSTHQGSRDIPAEYFVLTDNSEDVMDVIMKLTEIFEGEFYSVLHVMLPVEALKYSANFFVKDFLPRLITISVNPSYFHFMLLCSLVYTTIFCTFTNIECFTFAKLTSLCVRMVFNRCYIDLFKGNEEYESLGFYCRRINSILHPENETNFLPDVDRQEICSLLESLSDVDCRNFCLTDSEEKLLNDTLGAILSETNPDISPNESYESSLSSGSTTDENASSLSSDENLSPVDRICCLCGQKCFNFLILHEREVREMTNLSTLKLSSN